MKSGTAHWWNHGLSQGKRSPATMRLLAQARHAWEHGQSGAAERALTAVLALAPADPIATRMLGVVDQQRGRHAAAADCFRQVIAEWPEDADLRMQLGIALYESGHASEALAEFREASRIAPDSPSAWFNLGRVLMLESTPHEAVSALSRALTLSPSHVSAQLLLAKAQASLGQVAAAMTGFREVLRAEPGNAEAWLGLSSLNTARFVVTDVEHLKHALTREELRTREYELLNFALAKALEDQGDYVQAFDAFRRANESRHQHYAKWNAVRSRERVDAIRDAFAGTLPPPQDPAFGHQAIFIVSMPRSGSTLVEQILASHPDVQAANEIEDLAQVIAAEDQRRGALFPAWVQAATAHNWHRLGCAYLERTARWRALKPRFTDKSLVNWRLAGAALAMLPASRVVVVRRDPVETCLGCYRQSFTEARAFTCSLEDLADYYADFLRLSRFWLRKDPDRVLDLPYESLINDPKPVIRRLLDFCDLRFDPACLAFHAAPRGPLSGPSSAQVRQPLRTDTARSARYGDKLDPLRERLRRAGIHVG